MRVLSHLPARTGIRFRFFPSWASRWDWSLTDISIVALCDHKQKTQLNCAWTPFPWKLRGSTKLVVICYIAIKTNVMLLGKAPPYILVKSVQWLFTSFRIKSWRLLRAFSASPYLNLFYFPPVIFLLLGLGPIWERLCQPKREFQGKDCPLKESLMGQK